MHRFFVPPEWIDNGQARLEGSVARQISRVLRMSSGADIVLLNNSGAEYVTRLYDIAPDTVKGEVVSVRDGLGEPRLNLVLYQALLKRDKFEWVLQKGTELGISAFAPVATVRTVPRERESGQKSRHERWQNILREAAEQSGRCTLPQLEPVADFQQACQEARGHGLSIMPWEGERGRSLRALLQDGIPQRVNLFIGPEGGLEDAEVEYAVSCGIVPVSLGQRILRAETAAIAAAAIMMCASGDMGA